MPKFLPHPTITVEAPVNSVHGLFLHKDSRYFLQTVHEHGSITVGIVVWDAGQDR